MQEVRAILAITFRGVAMAMSALSIALMILELSSPAIIMLAVGLFTLAIVPLIAPEA